MCSKQKSLNFGNYIPNDKVLNKKVPENPKYKHVKPAIDTGKNVRKHIDELKEKQKSCIYKKDEVFRRIKFTTFIKLALAVAADYLNNESNIINQPGSTDVPEPTESSERRSISNVLMGVGELDHLNQRKKVHRVSIKPAKRMPYLLLDVRDRDAFSQCHIITAKHYPSTILSRSAGYEIEDLKLFKNMPYQLIVVYDDDETTATRVATTLVERGYENVYLLTGGLKLALEICPHGLVTSSQMLTPVHMLTQGTVSHAQSKDGKEYFTKEDIDTIQQYIEAYPTRYRGNKPVWSSEFSPSVKDKSTGIHHKSSFDSASAPSCASTSSRKNSTCSSSTIERKHQQYISSKSSRLPYTHSDYAKNIEHIRTKPAVDEKIKKPKKAPWK